jgi:hypothetical protein
MPVLYKTLRGLTTAEGCQRSGKQRVSAYPQPDDASAGVYGTRDIIEQGAQLLQDDIGAAVISGGWDIQAALRVLPGAEVGR